MTNDAVLKALPEAEAIESAAMLDLHRSVPAGVRGRLGLESTQVGGSIVFIVRDDPSIVLNRVVGLGLSQAARPEHLDTLISLYQKAGVPRWFLHLHPDARPDEIGQWAQSRGLEKTRGWMKFRHLTVSTDLTGHGDLDVRRIDRDHAADFGRIVAEGFDLQPSSAALLEAVVGRSAWHVFMSFDGDRPVGAASLFVRQNVGWLDWAATAPDYRRQGSQSALLAARIRHAAELGCEVLYATTGEEVPGDEQHSYKNLLKAGFEEYYLRENYALPRK